MFQTQKHRYLWIILVCGYIGISQNTAAQTLQKAYFASGCFWCVEAIFESIDGVAASISGYAGGHTDHPTYEASNTGKTGHAEAVEIHYDASVITFDTLVDVYFGSQNPTQIQGQGPDKGSQYRSILFYQNEEEHKILIAKKAALRKKLGKKIAAEIVPFDTFWKAEDYHQDYKKRNPNNPYIIQVSNKRFEKFKAKFGHLLRCN